MPFEPKSHSAIIEPFPSLSFFYYTWIKHLERNWVYIDQVSTQYACGNVSWRFDWLLSAKLLHGVYSTEFSMSSLLQCAYSFLHEDPQNEMIIDSHSGCMSIWSLLERHPDFFRVNFMTLNGRRTWIWTWTKAFLSFTFLLPWPFYLRLSIWTAPSRFTPFRWSISRLFILLRWKCVYFIFTLNQGKDFILPSDLRDWQSCWIQQVSRTFTSEI